MKIMYVCDNEGPAYFPLADLIDNFIASESGVNVEHVRQEVESVGWFAGIHENGRYLVLDPARFHLTLTPDGWDRLLPNGGFDPQRKHDFTEDNCPMRNQGHRDTGRGVCAHCGKVL